MKPRNGVIVTATNALTDRVILRRNGKTVGRGTVTLAGTRGEEQSYRITNHLTKERLLTTTSRQAAIARLVESFPPEDPQR